MNPASNTALQGLDIFIAVAELNSFSQAAAQLQVSKAHVSRQVTALEQRLGVSLFLRSTRQVTLTEAGVSFYASTHKHINQLHAAQHSLLDRFHEPAGPLRISVAGEFGEMVVSPVAIKFMQHYPDVKMDLHFSNEQVDLYSGQFDLAIRSGVLEDSSLIGRKITSRHLVTCASPTYFARHGTPQTLQALATFNCLTGSHHHWYFTEKGKQTQFKPQGNWRSNNARALIAAATSGLGIIQLPDFYLREVLRQEKLQPCLAEFQSTSNAIWAVYPQSQKLSIKIQKFVDLLIKEVQQV